MVASVPLQPPHYKCIQILISISISSLSMWCPSPTQNQAITCAPRARPASAQPGDSCSTSNMRTTSRSMWNRTENGSPGCLRRHPTTELPREAPPGPLARATQWAAVPVTAVPSTAKVIRTPVAVPPARQVRRRRLAHWWAENWRCNNTSSWPTNTWTNCNPIKSHRRASCPCKRIYSNSCNSNWPDSPKTKVQRMERHCRHPVSDIILCYHRRICTATPSDYYACRCRQIQWYPESAPCSRVRTILSTSSEWSSSCLSSSVTTRI